MATPTTTLLPTRGDLHLTGELHAKSPFTRVPRAACLWVVIMVANSQSKSPRKAKKPPQKPLESKNFVKFVLNFLKWGVIFLFHIFAQLKPRHAIIALFFLWFYTY